MNKFEKISIALLSVLAIEGAICVSQIIRIARAGFNVELTIEQAKELSKELSDAKAVAEKDMKN